MHLAVDATNGMISAPTVTDQDVDDLSQVGPLLDQIDDPIGQLMADGAYGRDPVYQMISADDDDAQVIIPPRSTTVSSGQPSLSTQPDRLSATKAE